MSDYLLFMLAYMAYAVVQAIVYLKYACKVRRWEISEVVLVLCLAPIVSTRLMLDILEGLFEALARLGYYLAGRHIQYLLDKYVNKDMK